MNLAAGLFLDLRGIQQSCDDGGRANSDRHAGLHQFLPPALVLPLDVLAALGHKRFSMAFGAALKAT